MLPTCPSGSCGTEARPNVCKRCREKVADGFMDVVSEEPLYILVASLWPEQIYIPKYMCISITLSVPTQMS